MSEKIVANKITLEDFTGGENMVTTPATETPAWQVEDDFTVSELRQNEDGTVTVTANRDGGGFWLRLLPPVPQIGEIVKIRLAFTPR